jgi:long-subunit acyl-CoA synthetase (AMP-forming)
MKRLPLWWTVGCHTCDIGLLEEDGYLSIIDWKKDMLIYCESG